MLLKKNHRHYLSIMTLSIVGILMGCNDSSTAANADEEAITEILAAVSTTVIYGTYTDLGIKADSLVLAVENLKNDITPENLIIAKQAWRNARSPWEQSEAFIFGPVDTKGIDPSIDSWPLDKADLDKVLESEDVLTKSFIDNLEGSQKGFHTIEYLLFGQGNTKSADDLTSRELDYLSAVSASFQGAVKELIKAWNPAEGNYLSNFKNAGLSGSTYVSKKSAMQELINGMIGISDEVANGKIADPLSNQNRSLEESQFSDNSNADFQDNIRSIQNVYFGKYGSNATGKGVREFLVAKNATLATRLETEIATAIEAIGKMTPTFGDAIFNNKTAVEAAQSAIQKIQETLEKDVRPLVTQ